VLSSGGCGRLALEEGGILIDLVYHFGTTSFRSVRFDVSNND